MEALHRESVALYRELGDDFGSANALSGLAVVTESMSFRWARRRCAGGRPVAPAARSEASARRE